MTKQDKVKQKLREKTGLPKAKENNVQEQKEHEVTLTLKLSTSQLKKLIEITEKEGNDHSITLVALL